MQVSLEAEVRDARVHMEWPIFLEVTDLLSKGYDNGSEMNQFIMCLRGRHWFPSYRKWVYFSPPLPSMSLSDPHISSGPKK